MSFFPDFSPYAYENRPFPGVVHIGWLDGVHPFPTGSMKPGLLETIRKLASQPVELYRGYHVCEVCVEPSDVEKKFMPHNKMIIDPDCSWAKWVKARQGNGEIRVPGKGVTFAAPILIVHYIEEHHYLPPQEFLEAVEKQAGAA